jgi:hypothetical protein
MKKTLVTIIVIIIIALVVFALWSLYENLTNQPLTTTSPSSTASTTSPSSNPTPGTPTFDQSISDGSITISFPSVDFASATSQSQITVSSYIPPCDQNFDYCLYYIGNAYQGTNFETAGLRIDQQTALTTQTGCLNTEPQGYQNLSSTVATYPDYAVSVFPSVGGAAAGHFADGSLYRLNYNGECYEFETRVGQSDFGNYPSGTVQQFTASDEAALQQELQEILATVTLPSGEKVIFPSVATGTAQ